VTVALLLPSDVALCDTAFTAGKIIAAQRMVLSTFVFKYKAD